MTDQPQPGGAHPPPSSPGASGGHQPPSGGQETPPPPSGGQDSPPPPPSGGQETPPPPPSGASYPPPPPPGGAYPPPPPSAGGYAPPPPGPAIRTLPTQEYTPWLNRALAFIIDILPYVVIHGIGLAVLQATQQTSCFVMTDYTTTAICVRQYSFAGQLVHGLAILAVVLYLLWNYGYRQGVTGSSVGKSVMKFKVVSEITGQPLGFGMSVVRSLAHLVDAIICFIGFLFPLWDSKRQTLADKIMTTVCLPIDGTEQRPN